MASSQPSLKARHIEAYVHHGRVGVLLELETVDDVAARDDEFRALARDLAIHVAACNPVGIAPVELPSIATATWRPVDTGMAVLLTQVFVRDERMTVAERIRATELSLGAPVRVRRFVRYAVEEA